MGRVPVFFALGAATLLSGCAVLDDGCSDTCESIYGETGCGVVRPGFSQDDLLENCEEECGEAMSVSGEVGDYDPYERTPASQSVTLENSAQAELWQACIDDHTCSELESNYCAPIW